MRARIALSILSLALLPAAAAVRPASAGPWGLAPGEWYSNIEGSTYTATTFRLESGGRADTGVVLESRAVRAHNEIGLKGPFTLVFSLPAVSITRRDGQAQSTATGFQDVLVGLRYSPRVGRSAFAIELDWSGPAGYNRRLELLGVRLGDGLQELSLELQGGTAIGGRGFLQGSVGYGHRYLGLGKRNSGAVTPGDPATAKYLWADRLLASGDVALWLGRSILAGGRYRGLLTLSHGALSPETDVHLAGPLLLYRVDDRLDVFAGSWSTASGKITPHFDQVYVGLAFHNTKLNRLQGFLGGKQAP